MATGLDLARITTLLTANPGRVTLVGGWSNAPVALPLPGGTAVARVTDERWIACQVLDQIEFGLDPGDELKIATTICDDIRRCGRAIAASTCPTRWRWWCSKAGASPGSTAAPDHAATRRNRNSSCTAWFCIHPGL